MNKGLLIGGVAVVAIAAAGAYFYKPAAPVETKVAATPQIVAPLATPFGITLQFMGVAAQGYAPQDHMVVVVGPETAYANADGLTLYTYDKDEAGKSNCTGDCAQAWHPAVAPANAQAIPGWTVIASADGGKQWAYKGKPLYTFAKDQHRGQVYGDDTGPHLKNAGDHYRGPRHSKTALPEGWHIASFKPTADMAVPQGLSVREVTDASGQALVNATGMTLYAFDGDANKDRPACATPPCPTHWTPAVAPQMAEALGDFTVVPRQDGLQQWAYKGKPLYTFDGDLQPTYANGIGVDPQYHVALMVKYFMPAEVSLRENSGRGIVLASKEGLTLYKRDGFAFQSGGGHSYRHGVPNRPAVGRYIGTQGCTGDCTKTWKPVQAAADAQSSGYWEVVTRDDGSKQWSYQGYPLYTYAGDKKPGDLTGNDIYDIALSDDPNQVVGVGVPMPGAAALYWTYMAP